MHKFFSFIKNANKKDFSIALESLPKKQFALLIISTTVALISSIIILQKINTFFMVPVSVSGGTITEGIVGIPTQINPILSLSDADKDMSAIIYSGLMRKSSDGKFIPDIAESYSVSDDQTVYTFKIKNEAYFHDNTKITADDIVFTINSIQDPQIKSPKKISWDGIKVDKIDENTVSFTLKEPYISFMDNTTTGILPYHLWKDVNPSEFSISPLNTKAIGSGPYKIDSFSKNKDNIPESYTLSYFKKFTLGKPNIKKIYIKLFANEKELVDALKNKDIDQAGGISGENLEKIENEGYVVEESTLPRMFGLFINTTKSTVLSDIYIRNTVNEFINRKLIIDDVLYGYGTEINTPIPQTLVGHSKEFSQKTTDEINVSLDKSGWKLGEDGIRAKGSVQTMTVTKKVGKKTITEKVIVPSKTPPTRLSFSITTGDTPELQKASQDIKAQLAQVGIEVTIKTYETGPLNQIIRDRDYETLFFGQVLNHESDLFSFWHSSQKNDPGLNITLYTNPKSDALLTSAQKQSNQNDRINLYKNFLSEFNKNLPAIFIYSPKYIYVTQPSFKNISNENITNPSDRFNSIYKWYAKEDKVWKIFTK
jgi:peptide/nickel transport system substrate-binding protein